MVDDPEFSLRLFNYLKANASENDKNLDKYPALSNHEIAQLVKSCLVYSFKRFSLLTAKIAYVTRRLFSLIAMLSYDECESLFSKQSH